LLRECGDAGEPLLALAPDSESAGAIRRIANQILALDRGTIVKPLTLVAR
jgi:nitrogenase subunit NifH